jgi:hypothetical protein
MACCQPAPVVEKIIVASAPLSCCHPVTLSPSIHFSSVKSKKDDCCCKTAPKLVSPDQTPAVAVPFFTLNLVADVVETIDLKIPLPPVVVVARLSSDVVRLCPDMTCLLDCGHHLLPKISFFTLRVR